MMPQAARAQAYSNLLRKSCQSAATQDPFSISSSQMSLKIVQKAIIASNLLGGNFATQHATSMHNKVNAVDPPVFFPQIDASIVKTLLQLESTCKSELILPIPWLLRGLAL